MPERCALILDQDKKFSALVERLLLPSGLRVQVVSDADDGLDRIVDLRPEVVFIAVDLPDRNGFTLCNRTKGLVKGARVVLATSTIPWREMELHQKLKVHADLYLDKRSVTEAELSRKVEGLLKATAPLEPLPAREAPAVVEVAAIATEDMGKAVDVATFLDELESLPAPAPLPDVTDSTDRDDEMHRLRKDAEEARRYARASPFSKDFLTLRDRLSEKDTEIVALKREVAARERHLTALKHKAREMLTPISAALREKTEAEKDLSVRLATAEAALRKTLEERKQLEDRHTLDLRDAMDRLSDELARSREAEARLAESETRRTEAEEAIAREREGIESRLTEAEADRVQALRTAEHDHLAQVVDLETQLSREKSQEVDAVKATWEEKLAAAQAAAAETVAALRRSHAEELAAGEGAHREELAVVRTRLHQHGEETQQLYESRLAEAQRLYVEGRRHAEEEHGLVLRSLESRLQTDKAHALEVLKTEWEDRLEKTRREHERALDHAAKEYEDNLAAVHVVHREALANQDSLHQAALRRAAEERDTLRASLQQQDQETRRRYEARLAEMQTSQAETRKLGTENQLAALKAIEESQADKDRAVGAARTEAERALEEVRQAHAQALATLRKQHAISAAQHENEKHAAAAHDKEQREMLSRISDELSSLRSESARRERDLRAQHEADVSRLQAELQQRTDDQQRAAAAAETRARTREEEALASLEAGHKKVVARMVAEQSAVLKRTGNESNALKERIERREAEFVATQAAHERALAKKDEEYGAELKRAGEELAGLKQSLEARGTTLEAKLAEAEAEARTQAHAREEIERMLVAARDTHATAQESHSQWIASKSEELAAALKRASEERLALEKKLERREQELTNKVSQAEAALQAESRRRSESEQRALAAVEMRLHAEKEEALATLHGAQRQMLATKDAEHRAAVQSAAEELKAARRRSETQLAEAVAAAQQQAAQEREAVVAAARAEVDRAREQAEAQRLEGEKKLERMRLDHAEAASRLSKRFEKQAEEADAAHNGALERAEHDIRQRYEAKLTELQDQYTRSCRRAEQLAVEVQRQEQDRAALGVSHNALMSVEGELRVALQLASEDINSHRVALTQERELRRTHEAERTEMQAALDKATAQARDLKVEQAGALAALQKHSQEQIASMDDRHKQTLAKKQEEIDLLRRAVDELAGLRAAVEQLRQRYPDAFKEVFSGKGGKSAESGNGGKKRVN